MRQGFEVIIVGAGTGGLCLAQGLRTRKVKVQVFEREPSPTDRLQGYRLSINAEGNRALRACLPEPLYEQFVASSATPSRKLTFADHRLRRLLAIDLQQRTERERPVSRMTLRQLLLQGLDDVVHLGKKFTRYEVDPEGRVTAHFDDGSTAVGDVLVGADGASSHVRAQLLPRARRADTGLVIVTGKLPLSERVRAETPAELFSGPTLVLGPKGCFLFANAVEYEASRESYVMWGFSARRNIYDLDTPMEEAEGEQRRAAVMGLMGRWHSDLRHLVETTDAGAIDAFAAKTSVPVSPWKTQHVTLLGDALHNMTPFRGIGANTALRDAAALCDCLVAADRGEQALIPALSRYERNMIHYGFGAVRASLRDMKRLHHRSPLRRAVTKTFLRMVDRIPSLKPLMHH
jgi:2-polyprenyl-6-methoxyphenol hydroxylase-like FAD-dependent oxidoreductase